MIKKILTCLLVFIINAKNAQNIRIDTELVVLNNSIVIDSNYLGLGFYSDWLELYDKKVKFLKVKNVSEGSLKKVFIKKQGVVLKLESYNIKNNKAFKNEIVVLKVFIILNDSLDGSYLFNSEDIGRKRGCFKGVVKIHGAIISKDCTLDYFVQTFKTNIDIVGESNNGIIHVLAVVGFYHYRFTFVNEKMASFSVFRADGI